MKKDIKLLQLIEKHARDSRLYFLQNKTIPFKIQPNDQDDEEVEQPVSETVCCVIQSKGI